MRREPEAPEGRLTGTFELLHAAGCIQTGADQFETASIAKPLYEDLLAGLMLATRLNPCKGCPAYKGGDCAAFKQYHTSAINAQRASVLRTMQATKPMGTEQYPGLSVKQIAERLGISKSEVRRRKLAGEL